MTPRTNEQGDLVVTNADLYVEIQEIKKDVTQLKIAVGGLLTGIVAVLVNVYV